MKGTNVKVVNLGKPPPRVSIGKNSPREDELRQRSSRYEAPSK